MKTTIEFLGMEYNYVSQEGVEFRPQAPEMQAINNMKQLEMILESQGFHCIESREIKWDTSTYIKIIDPSGKYVLLQAYFSGAKETIRQKQSVNYNISGIGKDVENLVAKINDSYEPGCLTCR